MSSKKLKMQVVCLPIVLLLLTVTSVYGGVIQHKDSLTAGHIRVPEDIRFAGTADGKTFFAVTDSVNPMNFSQAGKVCIQLNMKLAEITSLAQANAIHAMANSSLITDAEYWVAGRDSWKHRQFSWNSSDTEVSEINSEIYLNIASPLTCIRYHPIPDSAKTHLHVFECSSIYSFVLCEVSTSSHLTVAKYMAVSKENLRKIYKHIMPSVDRIDNNGVA